MNKLHKSFAIVGAVASISLGIIAYNSPSQPTLTTTQSTESAVDDAGLPWEDRIEADKDDGIYDYDCSDFRSLREAYSLFRYKGGPYDDRYGLDGDEDGEICEEHVFN